MSRPQPRHFGRALAATLGLPVLLLSSLTASAFTGTPAATTAAIRSTSSTFLDDGLCDRVRFGTNPAHFDLPAGFQPEGIAIDKSGTAYFGSRLDGDIYAASLRTGEGKVISQGPGTASQGMKVDQRGRLFVAGAGGGNGRVIDTRSGKVLAAYTFTTSTNTFVNDVVLSKDAAWFTDSRQQVLYQVPLGRNGKLPGQAAVKTIPLSGDYVHDPVNLNANGIELTPDGRNLIIVQSATGFLFRVDPRTGVTRRIDLGATVMTNGDGLLLSKNTLYVVQNRLNKVAVLDLDRSGSKGRLVKELTSTDFDIPTTAALYGSRLYLPNARFSTPPTPTTEYWVTAVQR
ncbi:SMP-30/gluconolactonase/LRE family protein [Streptomyces sp. SID13031]|uniref:SMP-30/gluconolactonase/LRE family protein n=1 Tax=Streptomyces sp. SID13031 TaxID=2706046 RepID=UPI0013CCC6C2|nr:SMP-30/gluconolactonase/LRE family protein [Streptomyces sp. SID13031]NEA31678.1 superoxide dismutase [Streptomyces sp. SID13031]